MRRRLFLSMLASGACAAAQAADLEINAATQAQLESLPGVGPALAERILAARASAPFSDWADLRRRVKGIGPATARKLSNAGLRVEGRPLDEAAAAAASSPPVSASIQSR
jgi:competence protein ComEA